MCIRDRGVETIERRSKPNNICKQSWLNDDNEIINELIKKVGCRRKYWSTNLSAPICETQDTFITTTFPDTTVVDGGFLKEYTPPCREIQTILSSNTIEVPIGNVTDTEPHTKLKIQFKSTVYKTIKNIKAFNEESLIGNLGGYVGLFLGIAIWQTPVFAVTAMKKIQNMTRAYKNT